MCQKCLKVCASKPPYRKEKYCCFGLDLFKLQENRLPSFFIPSREALFYFPCLLAHHNKLTIFNSESSFNLQSNRTTFFFLLLVPAKWKNSALGQQVAGWHHWQVPYIGNKCQKTFICPNIDQMREHILLWLSSGNTECVPLTNTRDFLPHSCMSPFLLRLPSVLALVFFILVIPGFASFPENCYCFVFPIHILFFFLFCCMETLCCTSVSIFLALLFLAYLFMFLCSICLCTALRVSWETVVPSICTYK